MYSLHVTCAPQEAEEVSVALWEAGTLGIREEDRGKRVELIAGFEAPIHGLLATYNPTWELEENTDWVLATQEAWPVRAIAQRLLLAPVWSTEVTPAGRVRIIHNPGLASGTGEHPCTQLALESLERCVRVDCVVVDVGTGSGILSIAALRLGARLAVAIDNDFASLVTAAENFDLNGFPPKLIAGSADCIASETADVVVANISGTVLLSIADELIRILRPGGSLILTGFPESELQVLMQAFGEGTLSALNEWRSLTIDCS